MKHLFFPSQEDLTLTGVLYALSDPTRLWIVASLNEGGEHCCSAGELASVPKSTLAHHHKVLRENGIITTRVVGTYSVNSLRRMDLDARFPGLLDAVLHSIPTHLLPKPGLDKEKAPA